MNDGIEQINSELQGINNRPDNYGELADALSFMRGLDAESLRGLRDLLKAWVFDDPEHRLLVLRGVE